MPNLVCRTIMDHISSHSGSESGNGDGNDGENVENYDDSGSSQKVLRKRRVIKWFHAATLLCTDFYKDYLYSICF